MRRLVLAVALFSCEGSIRTAPAPAPAPVTQPPPLPTDVTASVFERLKPTCLGCHAAGMHLPFFESLVSFESGLAANRHYVIPGDPDHSPLAQLLEGNGTGAFKQMPTVGPSFAALDAAGKTRISLLEVREWIRKLPLDTAPPPNDDQIVYARRKTAEQIIRSLHDQLGLDDSDFFTLPKYDAATTDKYPARSSDAAPQYIHSGADVGFAFSSFGALGGPAWLDGKTRTEAVDLVLTQRLVPMTQAWCRLSLSKPNTPLLSAATLADASTTTAGAQKIRENIAALYLRMLGEVAPAEELDDLFTNVFVPYEAQGAAAAWTAVCAALARDPLWLTY